MEKPKIRFKGYQEDWEQRKVSEIAIEKLSNGIMNNQSDDETGVKHINVINMYDTDKIHPEKLTFSNYDEEAVKKCNVEFGDVFLTRSSLKPEGIAEANVLLDSGRFVYDDHLIRLKVNKEKYDPFFVKLNLSGNAFKRQFIVRAKTTAFTTIGQEDISECLGFFPKKEEQQQIGEYFMTLDRLITLHQRKCDETKILKKYMLQKMFPQNGHSVPEIRFSGFTEDWEQRKLGHLIEDNIIMEQSDGNHGELYPRSDEFTDAGIPYIAASAISSSGDDIDFNLVKYLPLKRAEQFRKGVAQNGDILLAHNATVGPCLQLSMEYNFAILSTSLTLFRINENKMNSKFFLQMLRSDLFQNQLFKYMKQTTRSQVPILTQRKLEVCYPSNRQEQELIGTYLSNLDRLITLHQQKCNELRNIKKFMLQNMFI